MNNFIVLHITDFHIDDPESEKENLRNKYYREFINGLVSKIKLAFGPRNINAIVATGDFVNKNNYKNYEHVDKILSYLKNRLGLPDCSIGVCPGNHDIDYKMDVTDSKAARDQYYKFSEKYVLGDIITKNDRFSLSKVNEEVYFLSIDSTLGSKGENIPGEISIQEIDIIVNDIVLDSVPGNSLLLIGSHFPMYINSRYKLLSEDLRWVEKHYWSQANLLVNRVIDVRKVGQTVWLYGDAHQQDFFTIEENHHFILTGMIGGNYLERQAKITEKGIDVLKPFEILTEIKVVEFNDISLEPNIHTFRYVRGTFYPKASSGKWEHTISSVRPEKLISRSEVPILEQTSVTSSELKIEIPDDTTEIISTSVQDAIINRIRENGLYSLGRYVTSSGDISLGWISINKLFEDYQILTQCVEKSLEWLNKYNLFDTSEETVLFGVDFWGAILASQVSVRAGVKNLSISTRSRNKESVFKKSLDEIIFKFCSIKSIKNVVLFNDVICSGKSLYNVYSDLNKLFLENNISVSKWIVISVISDVEQTRKVSFNSFYSVGTFCGDIRLPYIDSNLLPDEEILPPRLDYR